MKRLNLYVTLLLALLLVYCTKENIHRQTGDIIGFINMYDVYGDEISDKSDVIAILGDNEYKARTNDIGRYIFNNIPAGAYSIGFEKEGFGGSEIFRYQFVGGEVPAVIDHIDLFEIPEVEEILSVNFSWYDGNLEFGGKFLSKGILKGYFYINDSANVSKEHYDFVSSFETLNQYYNQDTIVQQSFYGGYYFSHFAPDYLSDKESFYITFTFANGADQFGYSKTSEIGLYTVTVE